jgi:hypothetical protein
VRAAGAVGVSLPVGQLIDVVDQGENLARKNSAGQTLTEAEQGELVESALALALNPPSVASELQGRYGVADNFDVGLRIASSITARLDGRWQFLPAREGTIAGSLGLGVGYYAKTFEISGPIESVVAVSDVLRIEMDIPVLFGWSGRIGHFWFGPKLVVSRYWGDMRLAFFDSTVVEATARGTNLFYGAQVGGAVGYEHVWLATELTVMRLSSDARVEGPGYAADLSFGGLVIYPAIGLLVQI